MFAAVSSRLTWGIAKRPPFFDNATEPTRPTKVNRNNNKKRMQEAPPQPAASPRRWSPRSIAILILHTLRTSPSMLTEQIVYLSASGLAGIGRFLVLRLFVFADRSASTPLAIAVRPTVASPAFSAAA